MTEPVTCAACQHFQPGKINPEAGMGLCTKKRIGMYPNAPHYCRQREVEDDGD
jgi:hypothetical protein